MNLSKLSDQELESSFEGSVRSERKLTHVVLMHINEVELRQLHAKQGYRGMHHYLTSKFGYCESSAYQRINAARILKQVPVLSEKLEAGEIKLTQLVKFQQCVRQEAKSAHETLEILGKIENKTSFETEKILAQEFDKPVQQIQIIKPQKDESVRIELTLTKEEYAEVMKAKDMLSHVCPDGNLAQVLVTLARKYNQGKLGKIKVSRNQNPAKNSKIARNPNSRKSEVLARKSKASILKATTTAGAPTQGFEVNAVSTEKEVKLSRKSSYRPHIPVKIRRFVLNRADHQCEFTHHSDGKKCCSPYQVQVDHIQPVALGGSNEVYNLRALCRMHNLLAAEKNGLKRP